MSWVTDLLIDSIGDVESGQNAHAVGDRHLKNKALGAFQLRLPAYQDVQRFEAMDMPKHLEGPRVFTSDMDFEEAMADPTLQRLATRRYLEGLEQHYHVPTEDHMIAGYNAGPSVKTKGIRNPDYVAKVRKAMSKRKGNPVMKKFK